jgi:hypothetical protein
VFLLIGHLIRPASGVFVCLCVCDVRLSLFFLVFHRLDYSRSGAAEYGQSLGCRSPGPSDSQPEVW